MLTQVAALELAAARHPGQRGVPGFRRHPADRRGAAWCPARSRSTSRTLRWAGSARPQDVADAVLFLCSDKASWLTGEVLDLNGGAHLKRYPDVLAHVERMMSSS